MIQLITDEKYHKEYNKVVMHPMQSWEWGETRKKTGTKILRVGVCDEKGALEKAFLITFHSLPGNKILAYSARSDWPDSEVLDFVRTHAGEGCVFYKLEPDLWVEQAGDYHIPLLKKKWETNGNHFEISNSHVFAGATFIVDLSGTVDELLSAMKPKARYNIRLAQKKGVTVKDESKNAEGFSLFFDLYKQTIKRQNYLGHDEKYHKIVWDEMSKAGMATNLIAYYEGKPLAAYQLFFFKDKAYYVYGGTSTEHKDVMASNLLMWEAMILAKEKGCTSFDMWGALPKDYDSRHPWAGFHRFKEQYGGEHRTYLPTIDVVYRPLEYRMISTLWPLRQKVLEFIQRFK